MKGFHHSPYANSAPVANWDENRQRRWLEREEEKGGCADGEVDTIERCEHHSGGREEWAAFDAHLVVVFGGPNHLARLEQSHCSKEADQGVEVEPMLELCVERSKVGSLEYGE